MAANAPTQTWYWCLRHHRAEPADERCPAVDLLGPYPTEADAARWQEKVEARNETWDAEDRRWEGDDQR